ncbi:hypothetical protein GCM10008019_28760 [Deinococcus soli (ex Cha et al. 2016)]|nr:hypothetical protein GCM10008019_28760 [Deinococcus soli (ex Cha et al. 2016)]
MFTREPAQGGQDSRLEQRRDRAAVPFEQIGPVRQADGDCAEPDGQVRQLPGETQGSIGINSLGMGSGVCCAWARSTATARA